VFQFHGLKKKKKRKKLSGGSRFGFRGVLELKVEFEKHFVSSGFVIEAIDNE
jgi:hypothetical protein